MSNLIGYIISGLIIGILARFFYPGEVPMGWIMSILLGIGGSFVGGYVAGLADRKPGAFSPVGIVGSILGAMGLIFVSRLLM